MSNQAPHVQHESFMQALLNLPASLPSVTYIGDKAIIGTAGGGPSGMLAMIEPDWDNDTAEALRVDIINKSGGLLDMMQFEFEYFTTDDNETRKKKKDDLTGQFDVRIEMEDNEMKWNRKTPTEKQLEPLRAAIVRYIAVWL